MNIYAETERLILRPLEATDDHGMFELDSDPEVHRYLGNNPVQDIEQIRQVIQMVRRQYEDNGIGRWAVVEKSSGHFIGWSGLKLVKEVTNGHVNFYDLGYRLIRKYWGHGYATESARAAVIYGFNTLKLEDLYGMADVNNRASRAVLEKCGLRWVNSYEDEGDQMDWFHMNREDFEEQYRL
jgi:RimJ/RimL family protein N-acetyltransferase